MSTRRNLINFDQRTRRLNVPLITVLVMLCLMGAMVLHGWSQTNSFVPAIQILLGTAEGGAAGEVITQGDVTLYIPPNATEQQGTFSIAEANPDVTLIANDTQWIRPKVVNVEFVQPNGLPLSDISFSEPVEICFSLFNEQWGAFLDQPEAFEVQHYVEDADEPYWEVLPPVSYAERQQLCGQTSGLSAFALAIRVEAQVPVTGPTATATSAFSLLAPTRTRVGPTQTRNPERGGASSGSTLGGGTGALASVTPRPTFRPTNTAILPTNTRIPSATPRPPRTPTKTSEPALPSATLQQPTDEPTQVPTTTSVPPTVTPPPTTVASPTAEPPTEEPTELPTATEPPTEEPTATEAPTEPSTPESGAG